jgi:hypothetical protein
VNDGPERGSTGRTRLGNPTNGNAPRPPGACRVLMIGDLIGKPGRVAVEGLLGELRDQRGIDFVTANGENVAGGMGLTPSTADAILAAGVDVITSGNHIWDKREIYPYLESTDRVLRPLNYGTHEVPGRGWGTYQALDGTDLAVINLQGRTYMQPIENPFTEADRLLDESSEPLPPVRLERFTPLSLTGPDSSRPTSVVSTAISATSSRRPGSASTRLEASTGATHRGGR